MMREIDTLIIGGGQAGLAAGYYLQQSGVPCLIVDANERVGDSWRKRYDSLKLFTPRRYSALPPMAMRGKPWEYPNKNEMADYLEEYALALELPVQMNTHVTAVFKRQGQFIVETNQGTIVSNRLVVASGPFQKPHIPAFAEKLSTRVKQLHTSEYRHPGDMPTGRLVIVGGGNSGGQIAYECASTHKVVLSASKPINYLPYKVLGRSLFWWYERIGLLRKGPETRLGSKLKNKQDPLYGFELKKAIARGELSLAPRAVDAEESTMIFEDGSRHETDGVLWATGFQSDYSWLQIDGSKDTSGMPLHEKGVSPVAGLYYVGLPWQTCRGSALIGWVALDASRIRDVIVGQFKSGKTVKAAADQSRAAANLK
ncbi:oxidoreductase [Paenibacillus curdlanolyticus]|nr:oxidoreductase [Paenibacillus curdlanolyticus]